MNAAFTQSHINIIQEQVRRKLMNFLSYEGEVAEIRNMFKVRTLIATKTIHLTT